MSHQPIPNGKYKHYKGYTYEVLCIAKHHETMKEFVVYKRLGDDKVWIREVNDWSHTVFVDGKAVHRFTLIPD